ncbi:putative LuxR family transcriptional regulator [Gordonia effusa NBRC 100432]|uniref:Putative LuxR family transcriptional regulator n=2 Tax=Gordonia effusa TaxID=263908 RepID=H0R6T5_9ACTN|nr:putative LuxR family transcriptional regulator [Gordonia effusa NBRC 100432]
MAELVAALSIATDLGLGLSQEHVLRQTLIARRLGTLAGFSAEQQTAVFYVSLLAWVGCISDSHELSRSFGDDLRIRSESYLIDKAGLEMMRFMFAQVMRGRPPLQGVTMVGRVLASGFADGANSFVTHCQTTGDIADRLSLSSHVRQSLTQVFERWDGRGTPGDVAGADIDPVVRAVQIADDAEVLHAQGGVDAATEMLRRRRGTEFDPELVDLMIAAAPDIFGDLDRIDAAETVSRLARDIETPLTPAQFDDALLVFGDYADLKSAWFTGHSRATAELAFSAASAAGLPETDCRQIRNAALVAHLGRTGVSTGIWNKTGPLSAGDTERIRSVPYLTESILRRQHSLAELGALAGMVHERIDGSGYPRGLSGAALPMSARILAVADWYQTMAQARPHRAAVPKSERATILRQQVIEGKFDERAARAVLAAAGHRVPRRVALVAGLTDREVQVLVLLVRGSSNRDIAEQLHITRRTVGSHVEHIYTKIGVSTRGAAAMFAMRHGLIDAAE